VNFTLRVPSPATRPKVIGKARERLCDRLEHSPLRLTELHGTQLLPRWQARRMTPRRPERREALGLVLSAMLEHMDLVTYRVGSPRSDGHVTPPGQQGPKGHEDEHGLVMETGLSIQRVRRAIWTAVEIGWLRGPRKGPDGHFLAGPSGKRYQRVEEYDDKRPGAAPGAKRYAAHRVVYVFTEKFFAALGMTKDIALESAAASQRRAQRRARFYPAALLRGRDAMRGMRHGSRETRPHGAPGAPTPAVQASGGRPEPQSVDASENEARVLLALRLGLKQKHPDWGPDRLLAEARRLLRR
jgi:hypothetical protein